MVVVAADPAAAVLDAPAEDRDEVGRADGTDRAALLGALPDPYAVRGASRVAVADLRAD